MTGKMAIAALALAPLGPAPTEIAKPFCAELMRVVETAGRGDGFHALERARGAPPRLGFDHCFVAHAARPTRYCHQTMAPDHLSLQGLSADTAACLPAAVREPSGRDEAIFTHPDVRITMGESGGPRAHVGRILSYRVEAERKP